MRPTKRQYEILRLYRLYKKISTVAKHSRLKPNSVYKILARMRKNGILQKVDISDPPTLGGTGHFRLHGKSYKIGIIRDSKKYHTIREKANRIEKSEYTALLYKKCIILHLLSSFYSPSPLGGIPASEIKFQKVREYLETYLKIVLYKPGYRNIKIISEHIEDINNPIARDSYSQGKQVSLKAREDGKTWCQVDLSQGSINLEYLHPNTAVEDADNIEEQLQFMRDNPKAFENIIRIQENTLLQVSEIAVQFKKFIESLESLKESYLETTQNKKPRKG